jgi:hypothetical protein
VANGVTICKQIWAAAITRNEVQAGDPSAPAFWFPGQNLNEDGVNPFWTVSPPVR